jgi:hypothetical protein
MNRNAHVLRPISFDINIDELLKHMCINPNDSMAERLIHLARTAQSIARPKAAYRLCRIEKKEENTIVVEGITLSSRILRLNLDKAYRVFVGVATCGCEIAKWSDQFDDTLEKYWVDTLMAYALNGANTALDSDIQSTYRPGQLSSMCPGSLDDWPVSEQRYVFDLIGEEARDIGVELLESMLMIPLKSVSRIIFPSEVAFHSCQLCPIKKCPSRRVPYDPRSIEYE